MNMSIGILLVGLLGFLGCSDNDGKVSTVTGVDKIASFQSEHKPTFDVNEQGQAVWTVTSNDSTNIYLFSNNNTKLIRNTASIIEDLWIEDSGEISWIEPSQNGFVIYTYYDGKTTNVPIEDVPSFMNIQMNANGTVLWTGLGAGDTLQIFKYENGSITQLTHENDNILPQINERGDITWVELVGDDIFIHFLNRDGVQFPRINNNQKIYLPAENELPANFVNMNDNGDLVWAAGLYDTGKSNDQVFLYKDGITRQITDGDKECSRPRISESGQIVYHAIYENANEINLFGNYDESRLLARANIYLSPPQVNDDGFVVWASLDGNHYNLLARNEEGDVRKLMESEAGFFDSDVLLVDRRYALFLDGEWREDEYQYQSLYLVDLDHFASLADFESTLIMDQESATAKIDEHVEQNEMVSEITASEMLEPGGSVNSASTWSFAVIGDTRGLGVATIGAADPYNQAGIVWAVQAMHSIIQPKPEMVLMNGDMESYMWLFGGAYIRYENLQSWDSYFQRLGRSNVYPIKGNHELFYSTLGPPSRQRAMQETYRHVIKEKYSHVYNAKSITNNADYKALSYYFTYRDVFFVVFDSNYMAPGAPPITGGTDISNVTQAQMDWFKQEVVTSGEYKNANFRFAVCHYTLYPSLERRKANNTRLLELIAQHKFDAFLGACEHLYTDAFYIKINGVTYHMPVVTSGSMAKDDFDSAGKVLNERDFNKVITYVPGFLQVVINGNDFDINFITPTSFERKAFAAWQALSTVRVQRTAGNPIIRDVGRVKAGTHYKLLPNSVPSCDCAHRSGGCYIERPPPHGTACHCTNMGFLGCAPDTIVQCKDYLNYNCLHPDTSKNTCLQGGGNCGGY